MANPNPGDKVELSTSEGLFEGILIQSHDKEVYILKLDNGYNIGIQKKKIKKITVKEKAKTKEETKKETIKENSKLPTISILHTGGTIASRIDYTTGAVIARFTPQEILEMLPEVRNIANIKARLIRNMWSQDMRFAHYNLIAKEIEKEAKEGIDGIILTQGTDTIQFTAAALAFILEGLNIPVIIVGAQRSSDRGSSDAAVNLISACRFIVERKDFADVAVCMHATTSDEKCSILPATKVRKMHTSRRDAFKAIDTKPWAEITYPEGKIHIINAHFKRKGEGKKLKLRLFKENLKVGLLKAHTNMFAEEFSAYKNFAGLVIEGTGLGNLPTSHIDDYTKEHQKIFDTLKSLIKKGVIIVLAPHTIYGRLNLNVYENQRKMQEIGILGDFSDMTPETTFIKIAWLLSNYKKEDLPELITKNLRGEITQRIP